MKTKQILLSILTGSLLTPAAQAQVDMTLTGSTAFRSVVYDRATSLFDAGSFLSFTYGGNTTYTGTMSNSVPSLGIQPVKLRFSFSGSGSGMLAVLNSTPIATADSSTNSVNKVPDIALSDIYPSSASPSIDIANFDHDILGVIPFVLGVRDSLYSTGVTNITREQAYDLMTDNGILTSGTNTFYGMPQTYLGGSSTNPVYLIGRDGGSGTRITVFRDIGYYGDPTQWVTNGAGNYVLAALGGYPAGGYDSGAKVAYVIGAKSDAIGYVGVSDLLNNTAGHGVALNYNGVPFAMGNVENGSYGIWGYEHIVNLTGLRDRNASEWAVRSALIAAITDAGYQSTNSVYTNAFVSLSRMHVSRGDDGGPITRN